jgi:hypothetical protein
MAGTARRAPRYAARLGAAALRKKPSQPEKKAVSDKNAASLLPSPIADNAATPTRPSTSPPVTPYKAEPVARDPAAASNTASTTTPGLPPQHIQGASANGSQHAREDDSGQNIIQSTETVLPESSISATRKSPFADNYSDTSSDVPSPMRPASFVSATPSSRLGREKTPVS